MRLIGVVPALGLMLAPLAAEAQQAWDRQAVYEAREAQLKQAIAARASEPQPLVELAAFYLKPVAPRDVEAADGVRRPVMVPLRNEWIVEGIKEIYAVPWVFRGDPDQARPLLKRALEMDPKHPRALRESAMLLRVKSHLDGMRPYMEARSDGPGHVPPVSRPPHRGGAGAQRVNGGLGERGAAGGSDEPRRAGFPRGHHARHAYPKTSWQPIRPSSTAGRAPTPRPWPSSRETWGRSGNASLRSAP